MIIGIGYNGNRFLMKQDIKGWGEKLEWEVNTYGC